jgi:hypothetical protein
LSVAEARVTTTLALRVVFDVVLFVIIVLQIKKEDDDVSIFFLLLQLLGPSFFRLISKKEAPLSLSLERSTRRKNRTFSGEKEQFFFFDEETTRDTHDL